MTAVIVTLALLTTAGSWVTACYWYEVAIRAHSDYLQTSADNGALARDLERTTARLAEVLDQNTLLRDDLLDAPIPYSLVDIPADEPANPLRLVAPSQHPKGSKP